MLKAVLVVILIVLLGIVGYLTYYIILNFYSTPSELSTVYTNYNPEQYANYTVQQFYPNMRFEKSSIGYYFDSDCSKEKSDNMDKAFRDLEERTGILKFYESSNGEIKISCSEQEEKPAGLFVAGEGGPVLFINGTLYNIILKGQILLIHTEKCSYNVELHELLHVLGFDHLPDPGNIMYNVTSCSQTLSNDLVEELIRIYSVNSLPDLYFSDVSGVKKAGYLNLNFSVRNQGLADAGNVRVLLKTDSGKEESFDLGEIGVGEGKIFSVENLKVPLKTEFVKLLIADGEEIYSGNNEILLTTP